MLQIANDTLPQSILSYIAFRVALRRTMHTLEESGFDWTADDVPGNGAYLVEVPFLREVPLQVQVELLAETWERHLSDVKFVASLVDESVLYAACEFTASLVEHAPHLIAPCLRGGPLDVAVPVDHHLASELRGLYLRLSNEGDFLLMNQLLDLTPDDAADWKQRLGMDEGRLQELFDALGRWHVAPKLLTHLQGLVSEDELPRLSQLLRVSIPA